MVPTLNEEVCCCIMHLKGNKIFHLAGVRSHLPDKTEIDQSLDTSYCVNLDKKFSLSKWVASLSSNKEYDLLTP